MNYEKAWKELRKTVEGRIEACEDQIQCYCSNHDIEVTEMALWLVVHLMGRLEKDYEEEEV